MYILYISLLINLGFGAGSFVGHADKSFATVQECAEAGDAVKAKVNSKLGGLVLRFDQKCIKQKAKGASL